MEYKKGDKSQCELCKDEIEFSGKAWLHIYSTPRHPAKPVDGIARTLTPQKIAENAIDLFIEYRDVHGFDENKAKEKALFEVIEYETF